LSYSLAFRGLQGFCVRSPFFTPLSVWVRSVRPFSREYFPPRRSTSASTSAVSHPHVLRLSCSLSLVKLHTPLQTYTLLFSPRISALGTRGRSQSPVDRLFSVSSDRSIDRPGPLLRPSPSPSGTVLELRNFSPPCRFLGCHFIFFPSPSYRLVLSVLSPFPTSSLRLSRFFPSPKFVLYMILFSSARASSSLQSRSPSLAFNKLDDSCQSFWGAPSSSSAGYILVASFRDP